MPATPAARGVPRYDRTAAAILDAAAHVLSEHGSGANLADVAAAAGVSRATLYRYYPDRDALLLRFLACFNDSRLLGIYLDRFAACSFDNF